MTFFDILSNLFYKKKIGDEINTESLQLFVPFLVNRWLSFYDNSKAVFVNETLNRFTSVFEDKLESYKLYYNLIPQSRFKKINYVKKNQKEKDQESDLSLLASNKELSQRELKMYMDISPKVNI